MHGLHERAAKALGWPVEDTKSFSLPGLRELVRPIDLQLAIDIDGTIQAGLHVTRQAVYDTEVQAMHAYLRTAGKPLP